MSIEIKNNFSLEYYNSFHLPCIAQYFAEVKSPSEFIDLTKTPEWKSSKKKLFLGGGSNMLLVNDVFEGLVIHNNILGKDLVNNPSEGVNNDEVFIKVGGGENWSDFVWWSIEQGYYGVENLVSIPGDVAAGPIQNIGAYGADLSHAVVSVGGISLTSGTYEVIPHKRCQFGYRDSIFKHELKGEFFITDVTIRLQRYNADSYAPIVSYGSVAEELQKKGIATKPTPHQVAETVAAIRASKLPDMNIVGTAGSFFKNIMLTKEEYADFLARLKEVKPDLQPEVYELEGGFFKVPTGWILDRVLGYRGHKEGHVGCWEQQALCLVNYGGATGKELVAFCEKLQRECEGKLGVRIEPEVNFVY